MTTMTPDTFKLQMQRRCTNVIQHLNPKSLMYKHYTPVLLDAIATGKFLPANVGKLSAIKMCPEATEKESSWLNLQSSQKLEQAITTLYKCPNCKKSETTVKEIQTRSLDEASTIITTTFVIAVSFGIGYALGYKFTTI